MHYEYAAIFHVSRKRHGKAVSGARRRPELAPRFFNMPRLTGGRSATGTMMKTEEATQKPHLLIVDDQRLLLDLLCKELREHYQITAVNSRHAAQNAIRNTRFQVAMLDLQLGAEDDGLHLLPELLRRGFKVLVLTDAMDRAAIRACIRLGAHGVVDKTWELSHLHEALGAVLSNHLAFPQQLLSQALLEPRNLLPYLSDREMLILDLLLQQPMPSNEEMASKIGISTGRVKNCLTEIYSKFKVIGRHALAEEARRRGYFPGIHRARMADKSRQQP
ncbi:response regulator [Massilia sp. W12]|uniref:response regulator n=1 Tax=Massilia sp. W12 TaxID=3126507 RepID=UPI0030D15898